MSNNSLIECITDPNTSFLFGAGASKCASKPLMSDLTAAAKAKLSTEGKKILDNLRGSYGAPPTVETLMNQLLQIGKILSTRKIQTLEGWTPEKISKEILEIQQSIITKIGSDWKGNECHKNFFIRLSQASLKKLEISFV